MFVSFKIYWSGQILTHKNILMEMHDIQCSSAGSNIKTPTVYVTTSPPAICFQLIPSLD